MPQVVRQIVHRDQDAACQQIRDHQRSAVIRDMLQPDACLVLHIFHRQMTGPAYPGRTVTDFVESPSFTVLDELFECAGREGWMHDDNVRHLGDECYGREAPLAVIRNVLVEVLIGDGGTDRAKQKSPPVGRSLGDDLRADVAACSGPIFDDKGRAHRFGKNLRYDSSEAVGSAAGRKGYDDAPGFVGWIAALGPTVPRGSEDAASNPCGYDCATMDKLGHIVPPCFERPRCR